MKYIAIENNYGFQGAYWAEGDIVEAAELPNKHFRCIEQAPDQVKKQKEKTKK